MLFFFFSLALNKPYSIDQGQQSFNDIPIYKERLM